MSSLQVTSLWPIIISEMLQVFLQIEHQLSTDTEEFSSHIKLLSALDASWATNSNNGLNAFGHPHWLQLQLATAKLLDLALLLPTTLLPQFQMYRWAFVKDTMSQNSHDSSPKPNFIPHVNRISNLMDDKYSNAQIETLPTKHSELLLTMNSVTTLKDLHPFFKTLTLSSNRYRADCVRSSGSSSADYVINSIGDKKASAVLEKIDKTWRGTICDRVYFERLRDNSINTDAHDYLKREQRELREREREKIQITCPLNNISVRSKVIRFDNVSKKDIMVKTRKCYVLTCNKTHDFTLCMTSSSILFQQWYAARRNMELLKLKSEKNCKQGIKLSRIFYLPIHFPEPIMI
ncbi:hypothetical protein Trydic_g139 [Trypoxylus dichotomus]